MRAALTAAAALLLATDCATAPRMSTPRPAGAAPRVELGQVPFHAQRRYQCGPAALSTELAPAGVTVDPDRLVGDVYLPDRRGSLQTELVAAVRRRDLLAYEREPTLESLVRELEAGRPALVLQNLGAQAWPRWHYAVVVGYDIDRDVIVLRSGIRARVVMRRARFETTWRRGGGWAIVVARPEDVPKSARPLRFVSGAHCRCGGCDRAQQPRGSARQARLPDGCAAPARARRGHRTGRADRGGRRDHAARNRAAAFSA